ncbi:MAG: ATP-binding protein [Pseudomonadota bacterium]
MAANTQIEDLAQTSAAARSHPRFAAAPDKLQPAIQATPGTEPNQVGGLRAGVAISLLIIASVAIALVALVSFSYFHDQAANRTNAQAQLYAGLLERSIERYRYLPSILAADVSLQEVVKPSGTGQTAGENAKTVAASLRLEEFARTSGLEAIYVMDGDGNVLAASNHRATISFLGQNYGFRPYFIDALAGKVGEYFAVGATTGRPGYFIAAPLDGQPPDGQLESPRPAGADGVVAVKLDVAELQAVLSRADVPIIVTNEAGVVVLSSNTNLLYTSVPQAGPALSNLAGPATNSTDGTSGGTDPRQFGRVEITPADWVQENSNDVLLNGESYVVGTATILRPEWQVRFLLPSGQVTRSALGATSLAALAILLVLLLATFLRSRRIEMALATSRESRRRLAAANADLNRAQFRLRQRDKLVTLGHLSACISHELSQPISAMRNHLAAAEFEGNQPSPDTLGRLSRLVERISGITMQLRFFATADDQAARRVDVSNIVANAVDLVRHDALQADVELQVGDTPDNMNVEGIALRLEQAVVNLLRNALRAASEGCDDGRDDAPDAVAKVCIWVQTLAHHELAIRVRDTGPGVRGVELERLTEPFVTTRASGDGMGLGLSIVDAIAAEHSGRLEVESSSAGALFSIVLPMVDRGQP